MNKNEFISELDLALCDLTSEDRQDSLSYYKEMIDDRMESGMSEEAAVADLGSPKQAAYNIMIDMPLPKLIKNKCKLPSGMAIWAIVLLALGSPIWLSLAIAVITVILSVYVVIWSLVISIWATDVALLGAGIGCTVSAVLMLFTSPTIALMNLGVGLFSLGGSVLMFFGCRIATDFLVKCTIWLTRFIKRLFIRKEIK